MTGAVRPVGHALTDATEPTDVGQHAPAIEAGREATHPTDLDGFLGSVERRALRVAELALGHREDALDAVQEAMIKLVRYRHRPASDWSPLFWSILRRQLTDRHRRNAVRRRVMGWLGRAEEDREDLLESQPDPMEDPARRHADGAAWAALSRAVQALPRRQRECFLLREMQGLDVAETARAMGCSEGSVKTHLSRALAALRITLEEWK
ncbi:RNA polymerase sigma factor [soil metagenome]